MRISVVICTLNRAPELRLLLEALRHQVHTDFEVIVVAGPCTDETDELLAEVGDTVRVVRNPDEHLSRSRNLGIDAAAGELVAFIDDDAVPEPRWLARLAEELRDPALGGVGGFVRLRDGVGWQQRYVVCTRSGEAIQLDEPPPPEMSLPGADPFVFAMGGNGCYRRSALEHVGGFDEEIEYYLDETDLGARLTDAGLPIRQVEGAAIIHRTRASRMRDASGRLTDPFAVVKNHTYCARMNKARDADESIARWAEFWRREARSALEQGVIDEAACAFAIARVDEGLAAGEAAAARGERRTRAIEPADPEAFRPYPTIERAPEARRAAFVSSSYPPAAVGGIGRYSQDLATGLAARGWEMHAVVVDGEQAPSVEFENGVWVHRGPAPRLPGARGDDAVANALARTAGAHAALLEVERRFGPLDVVSAPLWSGEALVPSLDQRWPTITTLMTSMRTVTGLYPDWPPALVVRLLDLESETLRHAQHLHAISQDVLDDVRTHYPRELADTPADVVHLGVPVRAAPRGARRAPPSSCCSSAGSSAARGSTRCWPRSPPCSRRTRSASSSSSGATSTAPPRASRTSSRSRPRTRRSPRACGSWARSTRTR
jgi:glycogen(starch) synthase